MSDYNGVQGAFSLYGGLAPANDQFASAQAITGRFGRVTGISFPASVESGEPHHGGNVGGASIWYRWLAPFSGYVTFNTDGSDFNTVMGVYTGTGVSTLTTIIGDDNYDTGTNSSGTSVSGSSVVRFYATQNTTYFMP